jgi:hypothetical protein
MAGDFSRGWQQDILEATFGRFQALTAINTTEQWFHLFTSTLNDAATAATAGRCTGGNYDSVLVANTSSNWNTATAADPSVASNKTEVSFTPSSGASTGWTTLQAVMVTSSSDNGGVAYLWADLSTDQTVAVGNTVKFSTGAFTVSLT